MADNNGKAGKVNKNIEPGPSGSLVWDSGDPAGSLNRILKYVEGEAKNAIDWYWRNKGWKRFFSRTIQFSSVVLAAAAGIAPIILQLLRPTWPKISTFDSGLMASLLVGIAASLIGLDKAFGFSTGWARYVLTSTNIRKALEEFRMDWTALSAAAANPPKPDQAAAMIQRAKEFSSMVEGLVTQETKDWVTEFQSNMAQIEKDVKVQLDTLKSQVDKAATAAKPGSIELTVPNADKTDGFKFQVVLENQSGIVAQENVTNSTSWARINVNPGQYKVTINATVQSKPVSHPSILEVKTGETAKPVLTLPIS